MAASNEPPRPPYLLVFEASDESRSQPLTVEAAGRGAIFEKESWRLISPGVNVVVPQNNSAAHAEMVAIMVAQAGLGTFDLGGEGRPAYELVTSTEPCAMCFGAVPWSGVRTIVCGARDEDARGCGFDEGAKISDWATELEERGISVERDVLREESAEVLREYANSGGVIYNGRRGENGEEE